MIEYLKKLFSGQYRHIFTTCNLNQLNCETKHICKKCEYDRGLVFFRYGLTNFSLCKISNNDYIIKSIIE